MNKHLILGPPGTGKTTELLITVDEAIRNGTSSEKIGFISFTRKATYEAQGRAIEKFNLPRGKLPYFKTIHSLCFSELGLIKNQIMQKDNYKELGKILGIDFTGFYSEEEGLPSGAAEGDKLLFIDNYARATDTNLKAAWEKIGKDVAVWQEVKQFSKTLGAFKRSNGLVDFTDMLEDYLINGGALPIDIMIIDEAQDLSRLQWKVVELMMASCTDVWIAGDDDQAIYKWSGADVHYFLNLDVDHKQILNHSYRLPSQVYEFAKRIAERIPTKERYIKEFTSTGEKGDLIRISDPNQIEIKGDDTWLLLARNTYMLKELAAIAHRQGTVYENRGRKSVAAPHIRAIQTWERLRREESIERSDVINIYKLMKVGKGIAHGFKSCKHMGDDELYSQANLIKDWGLLVTGIWHEVLTDIPAETRAYYLLILRAGRRLTAKAQVVINTIHGVKGGEADHVLVLPDMAYKTFLEYEMNPADEHRVFYVAASRARQTLTLASPRSNYFYDW